MENSLNKWLIDNKLHTVLSSMMSSSCWDVIHILSRISTLHILPALESLSKQISVVRPAVFVPQSHAMWRLFYLIMTESARVTTLNNWNMPKPLSSPFNWKVRVLNEQKEKETFDVTKIYCKNKSCASVKHMDTHWFCWCTPPCESYGCGAW